MGCSLWGRTGSDMTEATQQQQQQQNWNSATMCALSRAQLFATPFELRPPGSSVHGMFQARILEWVAISYSRGPS